ncbi:MAG: bifunctional nuclease family protein [Coriobacteriia bacterium]|nr:bifunctional nuclease family protein [Coriobacteriia bacterium]MDR2714075.1 bifunctional nuclease family protein [Coriobacteriales bacterium]
MVPVTIETLVVAVLPTPSVVVLRPKHDDAASENAFSERVLPIWIGPTEAASIGIALEGQTHLRPMTHDFIVNTLGALKSKVERVVIDRSEGSTFFATVYLEREGQTVNIDARPSDSIALAVRMNAPLFVDEDVLNSSSYPYDFSKTDDTEATMDEFHSFIESLSPEDFSHTE